ncbi:MAG: SgcJ/EcaC family oxidoreductase [Planctomycetia bacterium]|nr:SgcJ/EcaC family oxidoreductase [Planctomycetia bacterium]
MKSLATYGLLALLAAGLLNTGHGQAPRSAVLQPVQSKEAPKATDDKEREADRAALRQSTAEFVQAFEKGDAKALAALWTEQGEYREDGGTAIRGRAALEKAYTELFKAKPKARVEVEVRSLRFPSRDTAIEEGILRLKPAGAELPTATRYSVLHVREDGKWKLASVHETGAAEDKLEDLAWLIGNWAAKAKDREIAMSYEWNAKRTRILQQFSAKEGGKVVASGTQTIAWDPQSGRLRSWLHDDDGGHGQALWFRDGNRWVLDALGVLPDGRETSATNLITRLSDDEFLWRSTHRSVGGSNIPDAEPVKVARVKTGK